jgi:hypothetical protein
MVEAQVDVTARSEHAHEALQGTYGIGCVVENSQAGNQIVEGRGAQV